MNIKVFIACDHNHGHVSSGGGGCEGKEKNSSYVGRV